MSIVKKLRGELRVKCCVCLNRLIQTRMITKRSQTMHLHSGQRNVTIPALMETPKKYHDGDKIKQKKEDWNACIWMKIGWGRAINYCYYYHLALYLNFFDAHTGTREARTPFLFFFVFFFSFFFGEIGGRWGGAARPVLCSYSLVAANYTDVCKSREHFKLALIKYWTACWVFFIHSIEFL